MKLQTRALWLVLLLCLAYVIDTWSYISNFWGDVGRWLHEVERFAQGERPYLDFSWQFPPFALWVFGGVARWFGSGLHTVWATASVLTLLLFLAYCFYCKSLVEESLLPLAACTGIVLSVAAASFASAPLPTGMYTPAVLVGALVTLLAAVTACHLLTAPKPWLGQVTGALCGAAILNKQDFWLPALYLILVGWLLLRKSGKEGSRSANWMVFSFVCVTLMGWWVVQQTAGWRNLFAMLHGFGSIAETGGRGFPSWERLVLQLAGMGLFGVIVVSGLVLGGTVPWRRVRRTWGIWSLLFSAATLAYLAGTYFFLDSARETWVPKAHWGMAALAILRRNMIGNFWPLAVPVAMGVGLFVKRRAVASPAQLQMAFFLLGYCVAARLRRLFEFTEWYCLLLELPVFLFLLNMVIPKDSQRRGISFALVLLLLLGAYAYWFQGDGRITRARHQRLETQRGTIMVHPSNAIAYRELREIVDAMDPSGIRPLLAYGYTGGFNYFLDRKNPSPLTQGFYRSSANPSEVIRKIHASDPPVILLDNLSLQTLVIPSGRIRLDSWKLEMKPASFRSLDRSLFEILISGCRLAGELDVDSKPFLRVYDCQP